MWQRGSAARRKTRPLESLSIGATTGSTGAATCSTAAALGSTGTSGGPNAAVLGSTWPILLDICKTINYAIFPRKMLEYAIFVAKH